MAIILWIAWNGRVQSVRVWRQQADVTAGGGTRWGNNRRHHSLQLNGRFCCKSVHVIFMVPDNTKMDVIQSSGFLALIDAKGGLLQVVTPTTIVLSCRSIVTSPIHV